MASIHEQIVYENAAGASLNAMLRWSKPYQADIYRVALTLAGNPEDADRVLLETVQSAWIRYVRDANQRPSLMDVLQIAVREAVALQRSRMGDLAGWIEEPDTELGHTPVTAIEWDANPESLFTPLEWKKIRQLALDSLTPLDRTVFLLRDVLRFTASETADLIHRPETVVKVRLLRARLRLREWLNPICRVRAAEKRAPLALPISSLQSVQV